MEGFLATIRSPWITHCVQEVRYQYWDPEPHRHESPTPGDISARRGATVEDDGDDHRALVRDMLHRALCRLHELPALRSLSIRFGDIAPQAGELDSIRDDLASILDALIFLGGSVSIPSLPLPLNHQHHRHNSYPHLHSFQLKSLSLARLPPIHLRQYDHPAFGALLADLEHLEIHSAGTDAWTDLVTDPLPPGLISPCEPFFSHTLPRRILTAPNVMTTTTIPRGMAIATTQNLVHLEALSLSFSDPIGVFYITYSFADLYFPRLRALRLQHVQFSGACDAERFITRHSAMLLELHLAHCQIAVPQNSAGQQAVDAAGVIAAAAAAAAAAAVAATGTGHGGGEELVMPDEDGFDDWPVVPRPWSDVYLEFANKLDRLVFLDVQDPWWMSFPDRYVAYSPRDVMQFLEEGREEDVRALEIFRRTVKERAERSGMEYKPALRIPDEDEFICDCH
ncbi:hypothetical protein B0F90DRAFT_1281336 [Multifurca ochricompacta]|uniref:Uncharacterized protein n=1 Tax=Multifurca ochricompacta TaxID=376703 RepID=A0AAD4LXL7_9AGAM|nr:hypothetical protein B0F90DRAFT_1281336 [Multifurca ochricompacta]